MSLGGFAQGLATAFQRAEDRYQDKKAREEARAEARLARASRQAFEEKMYTRRRRDEFQDELTKSQGELKALFGTDTRGLQMVSAVLPMGAYGVEMAKQYKKIADARNFSQEQYRSMFEVMYPEGMDSDTFGDVDLKNIMKGLEYTKFKKEDDPRFEYDKPQIGFKFGKIPREGLEISKIIGSDLESSGVKANAYKMKLEREIEEGINVDENTKDLQFVKKHIEFLDKKEAEALQLAIAKAGSTASKNAIKDQMAKRIDKNVASIASANVDPLFTEKLEDRIVLAIKGNLTSKLYMNLLRSKDQAMKMLPVYLKSETGDGAITYANEYRGSVNREIIAKGMRVYRELKQKAMNQFTPDLSRGDVEIVEGKAQAVSPVPVVDSRKISATYRKELQSDPNFTQGKFIAFPKYNNKNEIDYSKKAEFKMFNGFVKPVNKEEAEQKAKAYNEKNPNKPQKSFTNFYNPLGLSFIPEMRELDYDLSK